MSVGRSGMSFIIRHDFDIFGSLLLSRSINETRFLHTHGVYVEIRGSPHSDVCIRALPSANRKCGSEVVIVLSGDMVLVLLRNFYLIFSYY